MRFLKKDPALLPPPEETRAESWNKLFCKQLLLLFCIFFSPGERRTGGRRPGTWKKERKKFKIVPTFLSNYFIFLKDKLRVG